MNEPRRKTFASMFALCMAVGYVVAAAHEREDLATVGLFLAGATITAYVVELWARFDGPRRW